MHWDEGCFYERNMIKQNVKIREKMSFIMEKYNIELLLFRLARPPVRIVLFEKNNIFQQIYRVE